MYLLKKLALVAFLVVSFSSAGSAQVPEHSEQYATAAHLLDETSFKYFYEDGSGLEIAFYGGMVRYEWIVGPRKGNSAMDILYQSRQIGDDLYLVNFQEQGKGDFVSLVINLEDEVIYSSAILRYRTEQEMVHFKEAIIKDISRPGN
jgi:hypothetical protein